MCYNEYVKVIIESAGDGWRDYKTCSGGMRLTRDGFIIDYEIDGDKCTLTVSGNNVVQERFGYQNISISFTEKQNTICSIGSGSMAGSFQVFTRSIKIVKGKNGYRLMLDYVSGTDKENIELNFTVIFQKKDKLKTE